MLEPRVAALRSRKNGAIHCVNDVSFEQLLKSNGAVKISFHCLSRFPCNMNLPANFGFLDFNFTVSLEWSPVRLANHDKPFSVRARYLLSLSHFFSSALPQWKISQISTDSSIMAVLMRLM
jgi:hypothetical protein